MSNIEKWKKIEGYQGYEVSNLGRVRSLPRTDYAGRSWRGRILKQAKNRGGYFYVTLYTNGKGKKITVHQLVAKAFIKNTENRIEVNHIDGDKTNNYATNLEWSTRLENTRHAYKEKLNNCIGENHHRSKLNKQQVIEIFERVSKGENGSQIAREFNVDRSTVWSIKSGRKWRNVTQEIKEVIL